MYILAWWREPLATLYGNRQENQGLPSSTGKTAFSHNDFLRVVVLRDTLVGKDFHTGYESAIGYIDIVT